MSDNIGLKKDVIPYEVADKEIEILECIIVD
jgi:hypothetical protein